MFENLNYKDDVFIINLISKSDPEKETVTFVRGENELAYFLLHYNKELYEFVGSECFCPGNMLCWNYKELLVEGTKPKEKK